MVDLEFLESPIYKFITNVDMWEFIIGLAIIYGILFKLRVFDLAISLISSIFIALKRIVISLYTHFMLIGYERKTGVDTSEYRNKVECQFRGIKYSHMTNADTLIIEHLKILKPLIAFLFFIDTVYKKTRKKRLKRL